MSPGERARSGVMFFLSQQIRRAKYLHDLHKPNDLGHCSGCHTQMAPTVWPCVIRMMADDSIARQIPTQREATP